MNLLSNRFVNRVLHKALWAAVLPLCALWGVGQALATQWGHGTDATPTTIGAPVELPSQWEGAPLHPLAMSDVEQRFARHFPGTVARMTDGRQVLVLRNVNQPTRMLHPAADCYRGLGYRIHDERLEVRADRSRWRCFVAVRAGQQLRVCEHIADAKGQGFTDASSWYWAAVAGQSSGPWQAVTVATPL
jgi:hypothetical protein